MSSVIALAIHPLVNLFLGHSRLPLESLATYPVVASLSFVFRSMGLSFQEVAIAFMDGTRARFEALLRFALWLGAAALVAQGVIALTPLAGFWFGTVGALSPRLVDLSVPALQVLVLMPFLSVLLAFCRALLVWSAETRAITWAGVIETVAVIGTLWLLMRSGGHDRGVRSVLGDDPGARLRPPRPLLLVRPGRPPAPLAGAAPRPPPRPRPAGAVAPPARAGQRAAPPHPWVSTGDASR